MDLKTLTFNQQVGAVIRYTVKPEATRLALQRHPLFNLVASCPTHLTLEQNWFNFDRDIVTAKACRTLVREVAEINASFEALKASDLKDEAELDFLRNQEIEALLKANVAGRFGVFFPSDLTQVALEAIIDDQVPFQRLSAHLKDMAVFLRDDKAGELVSVAISYSPAFS